ncbi:glycosyltransferase family 2 protein [Sphaerobacter sp.]|uniref:glycosyltransferase family 2 protein n=1 Tax=Sphaerobacter sp. TaxID=2099654 RepID=UPI001D9D01E8|nr:glycosyltransferase family A protein [Sphaerobacter sp.]MBX5445312.1 glycosyltransferase family 2 protein [Sphaerobacter sp.]
MNERELVSIIVNNYNYASFLGEAIESALGQTYPSVEVIVVDDGSTDDSRRVIERYGDRIVRVLKANGGQASAVNAGVAAARGDIVFLLDADDVLAPDIVAKVVDAFRDHPEASLVQFRLAVVDAERRPLGRCDPPLTHPLWSGDLREHILRHGNSFPCPPTSGNAARAAALRRIGPIPEDVYRYGVDQFLTMTLPLAGQVVGLDVIGGEYRVHGTNFYGGASAASRAQHAVEVAYHGWPHVKMVADRLEVKGLPSRVTDLADISLQRDRMVSLKLAPARHPIPGDRPLRAAVDGVATALRYPGTSPAWKLFQSLWFVGMAMAPRRLAVRLGEAVAVPESRDRLRQRLSGLLQVGRRPVHQPSRGG